MLPRELTITPDDDPEAWPYDGDWLTDVKEFGAEHYHPAFQP